MERLGAFLILGLALCLPAPALAHGYKHKALEIIHPWTPAMVDANTVNIPVFMKLKNRGKGPDRLIKARTAFARKVEFIDVKAHASMNLPMRVTELVVAGGQELELSRSGPHLLLSGIKKRIAAYDTFELTLVFEKAGRVAIEVMVEEAGEGEMHQH